jgi:xylulokinase
VCESCLAVIREAALAAGDPVRALGISSQGEAFTPVARDGTLLGNAMVSTDTRAAGIVETWSREFGVEELYARTGHTVHPMFSLFKLLWVREQQPDVWREAAHFYCFEELLQHRLGLAPAISWPLAGRTMLFNVRTHDWDADILAAAGLSRDRLAPPLLAGAVAGVIPDAIAADLGLPPGVLVVAGGHDQPCGALGAGVTAPGAAMYATGTVECICPAFSAPVFSAELRRSNLCTYDFTLAGMYTTVAFSLTGGNLLAWFRDEWGQPEVTEAARSGADAYELLLRQLGTRPSPLLALPYFTPSGTPYFDMEVKGAIFGLRLTTTRAEVLSALLEGVAFEMRLNLDILARAGMPVQRLVAIGGGARNRDWLQLKADVLNTPINTVAVTEAGCLGVAMLAYAAHSGTDVKKLAAEWIHPGPVIEPNPEFTDYYRERFAQYLQLYPAIKELGV